jgi:hypothetical protein
VAQVRFALGVGPEEAQMAAQFPQIGLRMTNRQLSERLPLNPQELAALQAVAQDPQADLQLRTAHADMEEAAHILGAGDRIRYLCRELHHEAMSEIRWTAVDTQRTRVGIDIVTLELSEKDAAAMRLLARPDIVALLRQQEGSAALEQGAQKSIASASAIGLISVAGNDPAAFVQGGRVVQRVWLAATALGLAFQPMTVLLYMFEMLHDGSAAIFTPRERAELLTLKTRIGHLFGPPRGSDLMLFRLARAPEPTARALRLPLNEVLIAGPPASVYSSSPAHAAAREE